MTEKKDLCRDSCHAGSSEMHSHGKGHVHRHKGRSHAESQGKRPR